MWHILTLVRFLKVQNGKTKTVDAFQSSKLYGNFAITKFHTSAFVRSYIMTFI